jgi:hypothetical protein
MEVCMKRIFIGVSLAILVSCAQMPRRYTTSKPMTQEEIQRIYEETYTKIQNGKIRFEGGNGATLEKAVKIVGARNTDEGISAENIWISEKHGERGLDWNKIGQALTSSDNRRKHYDIIEIEIITSGEKTSYYFDITSFFGKL